jgi:hypothetical protein
MVGCGSDFAPIGEAVPDHAVQARESGTGVGRAFDEPTQAIGDLTTRDDKRHRESSQREGELDLAVVEELFWQLVHCRLFERKAIALTDFPAGERKASR